MFSQKKSFFKGKLFYIILIGLFAFGYWINQSPINFNNPDNLNTDTKIPVVTDDELNSENNNIMDNIIGGSNFDTNSDIDENEEGIENTQDVQNKGYYLVKEVSGIIQVFYYDEEGKEKLIRTTDIAFSLLSIADQALFQKGVIKSTVDELDELLQDFES